MTAGPSGPFEVLAAAVADRAGEGADDLDAEGWRLVEAHAARHRVVGLASDALVPHAPPEIAPRLAAARDRALFAEMQMVRVVRESLDALRAVGVDPILLKGLHVSTDAFGRLGLRTNRDVDLLVAPSEVDAAEAALREAGYERIEPPEAADEGAVARWRRGRKDAAFLRRSDRSVVEVHWRLFDNPHLMPGALLRTERRTLLGGVEARVLAPEPNMIYLALHGALHGWSRLKWLADLAALGRRRPDAVLAAREEAAGHGLSGPVDQAFDLARDVLGVDCAHGPSRGGLRRRSLAWVGTTCLRRGGVAEIEASRLASFVKNASHYGLRGDAHYLVSEAAFDLRERFDPRNPPANKVVRRQLKKVNEV